MKNTPRTLEDELVTPLKSLPEGLVSFDLADRDAHASDEWPLAAKWTLAQRMERTPIAVAHPADAEEVSRVLSACNDAGIPVVPFGAGSGVVGGIVQSGAVALDLRRLNDVIDFSPESAAITVGAGMIGGDLEAYLGERGFTLGHYPQSLGLATVGGLVATRSSGTFSSKYGNIEDRVLALEAVLADGTIVDTKRTARSSTGPSVTQLFVGSEGTLGVITAVSLRIIPLPEATRFRAVSFDSVIDGGLAAVHDVLNAGIKPAVIRLYEPNEAHHLLEGTGSEGRALLVLAFDGVATIAAAEEAAALKICSAHGGTDLGPTVGEKWSAGRYNAAWIAPGNAGDTRMADAIEISALWPDLPRVFERIQSAIDGTIARLWSHFSHFYLQGASLYVIIFIDAANREQAIEQFERTWTAVMNIVLEEGGSVSHHHGVGTMRLPWFEAETGSAIRVLRDVKAQLDPSGILNPGKLTLGTEKVSL